MGNGDTLNHDGCPSVNTNPLPLRLPQCLSWAVAQTLSSPKATLCHASLGTHLQAGCCFAQFANCLQFMHSANKGLRNASHELLGGSVLCALSQAVPDGEPVVWLPA